MLLIQLTELLSALLLDIAVDDLRNNFLCLLIELKMRGPLQDIIQEVVVDHDQRVLILVFVDSGPDR